jgi:hypothetical protein
MRCRDSIHHGSGSNWVGKYLIIAVVVIVVGTIVNGIMHTGVDLAALEVVMLHRPKAARPRLPESTQARISLIQQRARREVTR